MAKRTGYSARELAAGILGTVLLLGGGTVLLIGGGVLLGGIVDLNRRIQALMVHYPRPPQIIVTRVEVTPEPLSGPELNEPVEEDQNGNLWDELSHLPAYEERALWPNGYTGRFYQEMNGTRLVVWWETETNPLTRGVEGAACFTSYGSSFIAYVVRDSRYVSQDFASCIPHEAGHLLDFRYGYSQSLEYRDAVWLTVRDMERVDIVGDVPHAPWVGFARLLQLYMPHDDYGWQELYAEGFTWSKEARRIGVPMLQTVPPRLWPFYADWMPNDFLP